MSQAILTEAPDGYIKLEYDPNEPSHVFPELLQEPGKALKAKRVVSLILTNCSFARPLPLNPFVNITLLSLVALDTNTVPQHLPEGLKCLTKVQYLWLTNFHTKTLDFLPKMQALSSLVLKNLLYLEELNFNTLPKSLSMLSLEHCPKLNKCSGLRKFLNNARFNINVLLCNKMTESGAPSGTFSNSWRIIVDDENDVTYYPGDPNPWTIPQQAKL